MEKTIITVGDANSSGGKVINGTAAYTFWGEAVAQTPIRKIHSAHVLTNPYRFLLALDAIGVIRVSKLPAW